MAGKLKAMMGAQDMTVGSPMKNLVTFSIPLLLGNLAQQMYSTVDSIVVGKYVGDNALAAIGTSGPVINLLIVLFVGISTGAGIMVSQYYGAKQKEELSTTLGNCITLTAVSAILMAIIGILVTRPLMRLLNTPDEIFEMTCNYMIIIFIGLLGSGFYNIISGILRGLGDAVTPLIFLLIASFLNIGLDIWFVAGFKMGVEGAAWATIIAQGISAIFCVLRLVKMKEAQISLKSLKIHPDYALQLAKLGLPTGLTQAIFSIAMLFTQSLTNSMGTAVIACCTIVMRVDGFAMMPNFTFGTAMTTFAGQNMGAGLLDRTKKGTTECLKLAVGCAVFLTLCLIFFGKYLMMAFTSTTEVVTLGVRMMRILAVGYIAMGITQTLSGVMRGAGDTTTPMWISLFTTVILRVPIAYIVAYFLRSEAWPNGHPDALYISLLSSWVAGALITFYFYKHGKWHTKAITNVKAEE